MKKLKAIFLSMVIAIGLISCENDDVVGPGDGNDNPETKYTKKGIGMSYHDMNWSKFVGGLKPFWHYSWGNSLRLNHPENVEYVPMFWGRNVTEDQIEQLKSQAASGKIKYLLGFNEPDGEEQANMTVDEAIELWPLLEEVGVPLGSPATVDPLNDWMVEFMTKAKAQNLRIDFVCVHSYGGANFDGLKTKLEATYEAYGLPIWITEFAVADWTASTPEENKHSIADVMSFMKEALPTLDTMDIVDRYAWFSGETSNPALTTSALYDENGRMTALGSYYMEHSPNLDAGPGSEAPIFDNIEGNLIENGNIGNYNIYGDPDERAPESVGWFGYQFVAEPDNAVEGYSARMKNGWSGDSGLNNTMSVEPGKTYSISYYVKWMGMTGSIKMSLKDHDAIIAWEEAGKPSGQKPGNLALSDAVKADEEGNNEWTKVEFEYQVPEGVNTLRLGFWKGNGTSECLIDEVFAQEKN